MRKQCELCYQPARMHCESDQASLCWECDAKVHGANFLVARHTRSLLCRSCQAPTPWRASGSRLGPTVSVCGRCLDAGAESGVEKGEAGGVGIGNRGGRIETDSEAEEDLSVEDEGDDAGEEGDEDEEDEEEEDGDNQVVPWSTEPEATAATPPPLASCSSSEESSSGGRTFCQRFLKRTRGNPSPSTSHWQDKLFPRCSSSQPGYLRRTPAAPAAHSGRMPEDCEAEISSLGGPISHRKRTALTPRRDRLPRGASGTVDLFLPSSSSPPI